MGWQNHAGETIEVSSKKAKTPPLSGSHFFFKAPPLPSGITKESDRWKVRENRRRISLIIMKYYFNLLFLFYLNYNLCLQLIAVYTQKYLPIFFL